MTPEQRHREGLERVQSLAVCAASLIRRERIRVYGLNALASRPDRIGECRGRLHADHVIDKQRLKHWHSNRERLFGEPLICLACGGAGGEVKLVAGVEPVCCGRFLPDGQCCSMPVPSPVEEQALDPCAVCGGSGAAELAELIADHRNAWWLCESHNTGSGKARCEFTRAEVARFSVDVEGFSADYHLEWSLRREFGERAAA